MGLGRHAFLDFECAGSVSSYQQLVKLQCKCAVHVAGWILWCPSFPYSPERLHYEERHRARSQVQREDEQHVHCDCTWETSLHCKDFPTPVRVANEEGCHVKVEKAYEVIAVASCDADAVLLHDVTKLINSCGAATTESACSSVRSNSSVRARCGLDEAETSAGSGIHGIWAVAAALAAAALSVFCSA